MFQDLHRLTEDERIEHMGQSAMRPGQYPGHRPIVGFAVEDDAKADRCVRKLLEKFPQLQVISRQHIPGPAVFVRMQRMAAS